VPEEQFEPVEEPAEVSASEPEESGEPAPAEVSASEPEESGEPASAEVSASEPEESELETQLPILRPKSK
jgi:hypothetical protein